MAWEVIPDAEMPAVSAALREHRCVACYGAVPDEHSGFYCCGCDDVCPPECAAA